MRLHLDIRLKSIALIILIYLVCGEAPSFGASDLGSKEEAGRSAISVKRNASSFSLEFRNAELKDVLRALGQENHLNIIISDDVDGKLTLSFRDVTFEEALEAILKINNLTSFREGDIIRVMKSPFGEGEADLATRIIPIHFANAKETQDSVKGLLTKKGSLTVDTRTNALVVRDYTWNMAKIMEIVRQLDGKTPQVMIEARIVEVNSNFTRELGVQWGGKAYDAGASGSMRVTGATGNPVGSGGTPGILTGGTGLSGNSLAVNLPAAVGVGSGGALGFTFGNIGSTLQLDLQLSAMEDTGKGKILSNPRILTLNNKEAKISNGTEILIPTTSILSTASSPGTTSAGASATTGVTVINAKLELTVTPHITPDNQILIHVKTDKKDPDFNRQIQNIPPLTTRTAETDLLVGDKETVVIGGIYTRNESQGEKGVPWLSKIPILGWLFKKETKTDIQNELLIFLTPTVYKGEGESVSKQELSAVSGRE
ncbi:MAG: type IV pilus secretin PilQ [Nitrospirae bacterium]|nr:type IV pilus secretin PilQ [Nitrospirota bacterium]MBI3804792.1 type IV pilus secretin PilQ [Candidatus Manganitrophaceae bacterium]